MTPVQDYVFTRDHIDNNKINLQHYLWVKLFGYLIHPKISLHKCSKTRIADIGTGTAIWHTELSTSLPPSVQLDGLDISFNATPPARSFPATSLFDILTKLVGMTSKAPLPNHPQFCSYIICAKCADSLYLPHLEPGGYIQWGEADVASFRIEKVSGEIMTDGLMKLLQLSQPRDERFNPTWVSSLSSCLAAAGLEVVERDVKDASAHLGWTTHQCNLPVHELIARQRGDQETLRTLREVMPQVIAETREGAYWAFTRQVVIGRKYCM
ncbi:AhpC-TSA-2 domain containing protein [Naviculisporaceae sp. PSN 640]